MGQTCGRLQPTHAGLEAVDGLAPGSFDNETMLVLERVFSLVNRPILARLIDAAAAAQPAPYVGDADSGSNSDTVALPGRGIASEGHAAVPPLGPRVSLVESDVGSDVLCKLPGEAEIHADRNRLRDRPPDGARDVARHLVVEAVHAASGQRRGADPVQRGAENLALLVLCVRTRAGALTLGEDRVVWLHDLVDRVALTHRIPLLSCLQPRV